MLKMQLNKHFVAYLLQNPTVK